MSFVPVAIFFLCEKVLYISFTPYLASRQIDYGGQNTKCVKTHMGHFAEWEKRDSVAKHPSECKI